MAATKFYLDCRGKAKDGKGSILITIYHNASTTTVATGIRVLPKYWNKDKVVKMQGAEALNAKLQEQKLKIDKAIAALSLEDSFPYMTAAMIKKKVCSNESISNKGHLISTLFEEYINGGDLKENTKQLYRQTLQKVLQFSGESFKIESIDLKWLREFEQFLSKTQGVNGRAIYLRDLKTICKYAINRRIVFEYPFGCFHIKHEETRKRCIALEELQRLYHFKTTSRNAYYREYFFLMLFLIGINSIDLLTAKKSQVFDGRFHYVRAKTGKSYSIKIEPEAQALLKKYEGKDEYLLEALDHCKSYRSFAREINDALKTIGPVREEKVVDSEGLFSEPINVSKVSPIVPKISTYYARHTWSTLAHELNISSDVAAMALGHTPVNRTTFIYIKPDMSKVDEANRKIIDSLLQKGTGQQP